MGGFKKIGIEKGGCVMAYNWRGRVGRFRGMGMGIDAYELWYLSTMRRRRRRNEKEGGEVGLEILCRLQR